MEMVEFILEFILSKAGFQTYFYSTKWLLEEDTYKQLNYLILFCHNHIVFHKLQSIHVGDYMA